MITLNLIPKNKRYIKNPCLENPSVLANCVTEKWIKENAKHLLECLVQKNINLKEFFDDGPYVGVGGIVYAILKFVKVFETSSSTNLSFLNNLKTLNVLQIKNVSKSHASRFLTGTIGLFAIQGLYLYYNNNSIDEISNQFNQLLDTILTPGYQKIGDDEILNGRAGFLAGILLLRTETKQEILSNFQIQQILNVMINSGRTYSIKNKSCAKLMFEWHGKEYLGAAHGISGIYQILLSFWDLLDESQKADLHQSIDWYLTLQSKEGNFPSSSRHIGEDLGDNELVHWCHGAPGVIHMLINAYLVLKDRKYLESAEKCASVIWEKGILRKGPGICHGIAGNGYAFLLMYKLTLDETYLAKAKAFAAIMLTSEFQALSRVPDFPYSLFEGWAGALCFLSDLYVPNKAQFPMLPLIFN